MPAHYDDVPPRWQIAMLGNTSAGKTCYIGSFFAFYRRESVGGGHNNSAFTVMGDALTKGRLANISDDLYRTPPETPDPTDKIVDYKLFLSCDGEDEVIERELNLHDHAGEALGGSSDPVKAAMFDSIIQKLKKADAFMAFLDVSKILSTAPELIDRETEWATMHNVLSTVSAKLGRGGDTLPVVLALSKFDMAETGDQREKVLAYARGCAESLNKTRDNFTILICPVSVLKRGLTGQLQRNLLNIPTPFLFVSAAIILRNAAWHAEQATHHRRQGEAIEEQIRRNKESMRGLFGGLLRRVANLRLRFRQVTAIDPAIGREVKLQENDLEFADSAIDYLVSEENTRYIELTHRGNVMDISDYIRSQAETIS